MEDKLTKLADEIQKQFAKEGEPVTKEEALEMAREELAAKGIKNYVQSAEKVRKPSTRVFKLDPTKVRLISAISDAIQGHPDFYGVQIANPQQEITFMCGDGNYSIKLIKHRPPKK